MLFGGGEALAVADAVRLNYSISEDLEAELASYCELTGRTASDLVRQLICEVLEEDRQLPPPATIIALDRNGPRRDRRTDMWVSSRTLTAFDDKVESEGYPGKSSVIAFLLADFLGSRGNRAAEELVRTTIVVDRETYTHFTALGAANGKTTEQAIADVCVDYARKAKTTKN